MSTATGQLRQAVAEAISRQIPDSVDESDLPRDVAVRLTADRLVRDALAAGHAGDAEIAAVQEFDAGNTAVLVARVQTSISYVVKVDTSPALVHEAHLLRRMTTDPILPPETRAAFPRVYAIDETPPIFGYLMEDLNEFSPINRSLRGEPEHAKLLLRGLWSQILEPAYRTTRRVRLGHDLDDDYFGRACGRLDGAAERGVLPAADESLHIDTGATALSLPDGWGSALAAAGTALSTAKPGFGTWVHGDPNPENTLWKTGLGGDFVFRMLDPKDWWTGDYLFDVAKLGHYTVVTSAMEAGHVDSAARRSDDGWSISFDASAFAPGHEIEASLLGEVEKFASEVGDNHWRTRYRLAFAANLLGIAGPRAIRGANEDNARQSGLAWAALGYALTTLAQPE